eukprot:419899-Hanusia_phi.AAC.1
MRINGGEMVRGTGGRREREREMERGGEDKRGVRGRGRRGEEMRGEGRGGENRRGDEGRGGERNLIISPFGVRLATRVMKELSPNAPCRQVTSDPPPSPSPPSLTCSTFVSRQLSYGTWHLCFDASLLSTILRAPMLLLIDAVSSSCSSSISTYVDSERSSKPARSTRWTLPLRLVSSSAVDFVPVLSLVLRTSKYTENTACDLELRVFSRAPRLSTHFPSHSPPPPLPPPTPPPSLLPATFLLSLSFS